MDEEEYLSEYFRGELAALLNKHGLDAAIGTPDYLLARHVWQSLENLRSLHELRIKWFKAMSD